MSAATALDAGWLQRLRERLERAPASPRAPLAIALETAAGTRRFTIGSIEAALGLQLAGAGLPLRDAGDAWQIELPTPAAIDPTLAAFASTLRASGAAGAWRNELLTVADAAGRRVGAIERAAVRPLGIATQAVHLVVRDARGAVWVQQRAFDKSTDPGLWDTTMGGLVSAGESIAQTLSRETWEEAGLRVAALRNVDAFGRFTVRRPVERGYMVEQIEMFAALAPDGAVPVNQDGEVERFECLDREALIERLHADAFTLDAAMILARWLASTHSDTA